MTNNTKRPLDVAIAKDYKYIQRKTSQKWIWSSTWWPLSPKVEGSKRIAKCSIYNNKINYLGHLKGNFQIFN
jgi:hypothetical protein